MLFIVVLLSLVAFGGGSFLPPYQARFADLSNRITWGLTVSRETNRAQNQLLLREILVEIANGTVALRRIRYESNLKLASFRAKSGSDQDCLDSVGTSLDSLFGKAEQFLQLCVGDLYQAIQRDAAERFHPLVAYLHRESTYILQTTLDAVAEWNPLIYSDELEGRLDAEMDHFTESWISGQMDLEEDLYQHEDLKAEVVQKIHECSDGMVGILPQNIDNIMYYAENNCLEVN